MTGVAGLIPLAALDRAFIEEIRRNFGGTGLTPETRNMLILVLLCVVALLLLSHVINSWREHKARKELPAGWIVHRSEIVAVLTKAMLQRAKLEMRFLPTDESRRATSCNIVDLGPETLKLDLADDVSASHEWIDRGVELFFKIVEKKRVIFHTFSTSIVGVRKLPNEAIHLVVELPEKIELNQKRSFLRLEPPSQYLLGLAVWLSGADASGIKGSHTKKWGRPDLTFTPGDGANVVHVLNLSAGGMRLAIRNKALRDKGLAVEVSHRVYALLDLYDPDLNEKRRLWLYCRVKSRYEDFQTRDVELGLKFLVLGRQRQSDPYMLEWFKLDHNGVEWLGEWVMKRHLEIYREKGIV